METSDYMLYNEKIKKQKYDDREMSIFISLYFAIQALNASIKVIFPMPDDIWQTISLFFGIILLFELIYTIHIIIKKNGFVIFLMEIFFSLLYFISFYLGHADAMFLLRKSFWTLGVCIPLGCCAIAIKDKQYLMNILRKYCYVFSPLIWVGLLQSQIVQGYNMTLAYSLVLPICLFINNFFGKYSMIDFLYAIVSFVFVVLFGARGPILCVGTYIVCYYLFIIKFSRVKVMSSGILLCSLALMLLNFEFIFKNIVMGLEKFNIYSRTLILLANNEIAYESGRDLIFSYYWDLILQKPFWGWGIFGGWIEEGLGPHNALIECMLAFGVPIGGMLCILFILLPLIVLQIKDVSLKNIILVFFACNINEYFVSGNWLINPSWFIYIFLCLQSFNKSNRQVCVHGNNKISLGKNDIAI